MNLKCCIVDDEPLALDLLESYVQKRLSSHCAASLPMQFLLLILSIGTK